MKRPKYLMKLTRREGSGYSDDIQATLEVFADRGNHFSDDPIALYLPWGDYDTYVVFIYDGKYVDERIDALKKIGYKWESTRLLSSDVWQYELENWRENAECFSGRSKFYE